ncbi:hypothetical protein Tco_1580807, partial [Tanacetum coccineum]
LVSSDPVLQCLTTALEHDSLSPGLQSHENVPQVAETVTTSNELDLLFSLMFDELLNGTTLVVSKSSIVHAADAPDKRQQHNSSSLEPQCQMMFEHNSSSLEPQCQMTFEHNSSSLEPQCQMAFEHNSSSLKP